MSKNKTYDQNGNHLIKIFDVFKIYKRKGIETQALRGLSCDINQGQITVIMGPSGCGKTTLLNIIGGITRPSAGVLIVDKCGISEYSKEELETYRLNNISYILQQQNLIPTMTVWENITFIVEYAKQLTPENKRRIQEIIKFIGIETKLKHFPDELSGGEQQRVALATALAKNSPIILCDEPTGELDSVAKNKIMTLLKQIIEKYPRKKIIVVSHDPDFKLIADRVLYMRDGKISYEESREKLQKLQERGLTNVEVGAITSFISPSESSAIQELRELASKISNRLNELEIQDEKQKNLKIDEKI